MKQILIATGNPGKLREVNDIFSDLSYQILSPQQYDLENQSELTEINVAETGSTLAENAQIKAKTFATASQLLTLADDTGLMVKALSDFPGVRSDRWLEGSAEDKNQGLLQKLKKNDERTARFKTVVCLHFPDENRSKLFAGQVWGKISHQPRGENGFGYDAIFIPKGFDQTFAQLGASVKNKISHRHLALVKAKRFLQNLNS